MSEADRTGAPVPGGAGRRARWEILLWVALGIAMSPVLSDVLRHWYSEHWSRYSLILLVLLAVAVRRGERVPPRRVLGAGLVGFSVLAQLAAVPAAVLPLARPFLATGVVGMLLFQGRTPIRTALLALWVVPVPWRLMRELEGEAVAERLFEVAAAVVAPIGLGVEFFGRFAQVGGTELRMAPSMGALTVLAYLTGLVWYRGIRDDWTPVRTGLAMAVAAAAALPIQVLMIVASLLLVWAGLSEQGALASVDVVAWSALAAGGLLPFRGARRQVTPALK
jgi:hypothetical protein